MAFFKIHLPWPGGKLNEVGVQKGDAYFYPGGHAHFVGVIQIVITEKILLLEI